MMMNQQQQKDNQHLGTGGLHSRAMSSNLSTPNYAGDQNNNQHHESSNNVVIMNSIQEIRDQQRSMQKEVSDLHKDVNALHSEMRTMTQTMAEMLKLLKKK